MSNKVSMINNKTLGSVGTRLRCGGICSHRFTANLLLNLLLLLLLLLILLSESRCWPIVHQNRSPSSKWYMGAPRSSSVKKPVVGNNF